MDNPGATAYIPHMETRAFIKMHGAGNDFVVLDLRGGDTPPSPAQAAAIAGRHTGIGCDQLILIRPSQSGLGDVRLQFLNSDGSESAACGNGTRCVASMLMEESKADHIVVETDAGHLDCDRAADGRVTVDMGPARDAWADIPLAEAMDTLHLPITQGPLADPVAVGMGNPHAVFFVDDAEAIKLATLGPKIERHPLYPERTNVQVVQVLDRTRIKQRTWERGAGITLASGSGACAGWVGAARRGLVERTGDVEMLGGVLSIDWADDGHVLMTGPVATVFSGTLDPSLLAV
jgi:diaminopimelate epimerase